MYASSDSCSDVLLPQALITVKVFKADESASGHPTGRCHFERAAAKQKLVEAAFPLWERAAVACKDCIQSNAGNNQVIFLHLSPADALHGLVRPMSNLLILC